MEISLLNSAITIQKNTTTIDSIGNHTNIWMDFYSCHATVSGENGSGKGSEGESAGTVNDHSSLDFTVRYCAAVSSITVTGYRVLYDGEIYDLVGIDHMKNRHRCVKLRCRKVRRS